MTENATKPLDPPDPVVTDVPRQRPRQRPKSWGRWVGLALLGVVVALVGSTLRPDAGSALMYSKYVDEVLATPARFRNVEMRVEGLVTAGSIRATPGTNDYRFTIERNSRSMQVHFAGIVPDTFRDGIGVTVRGRLTDSGLFEAREVVAKCPSRYEMQAAQARGARMPEGMLGGPSAH